VNHYFDGLRVCFFWKQLWTSVVRVLVLFLILHFILRTTKTFTNEFENPDLNAHATSHREVSEYERTINVAARCTEIRKPRFCASVFFFF
jgi:hypothetical protein